eukprot:TRINITY_DN12642_c0_g1_i1.p1 TRINITY_DN12642_c0_g1~~TRINITY_DN12642_c0_g1_i1.p1  ORF type:complete len:203 (-),score=84.28 TRINITY_DN12642_c0_g1_i1:152-733(-)
MVFGVTTTFLRGTAGWHFPNRGHKGIYAGKGIGTGNVVTFSDKKNRRRWLPNVQEKFVYSAVLGKKLRLRITTKALRCIDKAGGLDPYLLTTTDQKLVSQKAIQLKNILRNRIFLKHYKNLLQQETPKVDETQIGAQKDEQEEDHEEIDWDEELEDLERLKKERKEKSKFFAQRGWLVANALYNKKKPLNEKI